jgi:hypothetical protein
MMSRAVLRFHPQRQPSQRLREACDAYRAAADAYVLACDLGCSGDLADALYALMQREATAFEARQDGARA